MLRRIMFLTYLDLSKKPHRNAQQLAGDGHGLDSVNRYPLTDFLIVL